MGTGSECSGSAGGHLAANLSPHGDKRLYPAVDAVDSESCRPGFAIALYPGHMLEKTTQPFQLNPTLPADAKTPPVFISQAVDDPVDDVDSLVHYLALKKAGVSMEMHLFAQGGYVFGLRQTRFPIARWPRLVEAWLNEMGVTLTRLPHPSG